MKLNAEAGHGLFRSPVALEAWTWPLREIGEALAELSRQSGLMTTGFSVHIPPMPPQTDENRIDQWLSMAASQCEVEMEPVETTYGEVVTMLQSVAPALLRLPDSDDHGEGRVVALLRSGRRLRVIGPDRLVYRMAPVVLRDVWCAAFDQLHGPALDELLQAAGLSERRQTQARRAILSAQLGGVPMRGCWMMRRAPNAALFKQAQEAGLPRLGLLFLWSNAAALLFTLAGWRLIGHAALTDRFVAGGLWAWALLVLTSLIFQSVAAMTQGWLATGVGSLLKRRLLFGSLQLQPEEMRHQGIGQFLGRILEIETVSQVAATGGFGVVLSGLQLMAALALLWLGAGGQLLTLAFGAWMGLAGLLLWRDLKLHEIWTQMYRAMTHDLVERMVGHRTRLAQEAPAHWHDDEDVLLSRYLHQTARLDRLQVLIEVVLPRGWLVVGLIGLIPVMLGPPPPLESLAISLGGIMLANQALTQLVAGVSGLVMATVAWKQLQPLHQAAKWPMASMTVEGVRMAASEPPAEVGEAVIRARGLLFRYGEQGRYVLQDCHLDIRSGDRLLLEGVSGGGKSTLAALLSGLRQSGGGILLLRGYDWSTLGGATWRRQVVSVPQFHENHVFTGTLAFNVLMGRRWPPDVEDMMEAESVCQQLGLGDLMARMPAGMQQMVGESGWRLSHGERSRIFIARALLQGAELLILDESFAALDPATLEQSLSYVFERTPTLLVIAHP
ncbi:MAG: hypothetical protein ETSY1_39485 [Candidatus Entotheonella factor]|uniref:ABC transporter domain-containing protein n=2 Tax=Candidatus Entotheonella TaxID=93171 RepID=W4L5R1_ENTF1|nr:MAG: hypothetical protein ETSY1_39485 [Candidatus Entotheonella factor]